jgi:hypothetical protein
MGTNFYFYTNVCLTCHRGDSPRHLGKAEKGWCFFLHVYPSDGIFSLDDWIRLWNSPNTLIENEFGEEIPITRMYERITTRRYSERDRKERELDPQWYEKHDAEIGPNNLARRKVDGKICIGHGEGTWDLFLEAEDL